MSQWWPIAKHLTDHLAATTGLEPGHVYAGPLGTAKPYPAIEVLWDDETDPSMHLDREGLVSLWIDCYVPVDDANPSAAFEAMYDIQTKIMASLKGDTEAGTEPWHKIAGKALSLALTPMFPGIASQSKITRPSYQSRIVIAVTWKRKFSF